MFYLLALTNAH